MSRSHGFFVFFLCVHDTAATRGQYLAFSKDWLFSFMYNSVAAIISQGKRNGNSKFCCHCKQWHKSHNCWNWHFCIWCFTIIIRPKIMYFRLQSSEKVGTGILFLFFFKCLFHDMCNITQQLIKITHWTVRVRHKAKILQHNGLDANSFFQ